MGYSLQCSVGGYLLAGIDLGIGKSDAITIRRCLTDTRLYLLHQLDPIHWPDLIQEDEMNRREIIVRGQSYGWRLLKY
jgi:hypothetical protein